RRRSAGCGRARWHGINTVALFEYPLPAPTPINAGSCTIGWRLIVSASPCTNWSYGLDGVSCDDGFVRGEQPRQHRRHFLDAIGRAVDRCHPSHVAHLGDRYPAEHLDALGQRIDQLQRLPAAALRWLTALVACSISLTTADHRTAIRMADDDLLLHMG